MRTEIIEKNFSEAIQSNLIHLNIENDSLDGRQIKVRGKTKINFGSCSYLGLEGDPRLIQSAMSALKKFGSQFSCSRAYLSLPQYEILEEKYLPTICQRPVLITPTTTLGHLSAIPSLIGDQDAVILDKQVHNSVQAACREPRLRSVTFRILEHQKWDQVETAIQELKRQHQKIWYLVDGLYSMYGDRIDVEMLDTLLKRHDQLNVYVDDAHGCSWQGKRGQGTVLQHFAQNPKITVAFSLSKSFAAGGGVVALANERTKSRVRLLGETMTFSGPLQPAILGSIMASAKIHLSSELSQLQLKLKDRIQHFNGVTKSLGLAIANDEISPIRFIKIGKNEATLRVCQKLFAAGFYVNPALFPAVPQGHGGIRITITNHLLKTDIEDLLNFLANEI